jgi:hypothetical protein
MSQSPYTTTKLMTADLVRMERAQRFRSKKLKPNLTLARELIGIGASDQAIARRFAVDTKSVYNLRTGKTYSGK